MKTMTIIKNTAAALVITFLPLNAAKGYAQSCEGNKVTISLTNISTTASAIEFDINISNSGTNSLKLASLSGALVQAAEFPKGTFTVLTQPSKADFPGFKNIKAVYTTASHQLRWTNSPVQEDNAVQLPVGAMRKFARFRFDMAGSKLPADFIAKLKFQEYVQKGYTAVNANIYCNGNKVSTALANGEGTTSRGISKGFIEFVINPKMSAIATTELTANAYPNPYTDAFHLNVTATAEKAIQIEVYNMLGKLVESKTIAASEIENVTLGSNYPAGIYNVTVSQGDNTQTVRIIKR